MNDRSSEFRNFYQEYEQRDFKKLPQSARQHYNF